MKQGFHIDIERATLENNDFRNVIYTAPSMQLVLMTLQIGEEIGSETHDDVDQFFRIESGEGQIWVDETCHHVEDGSAIIVPRGAKHNVINSGSSPLKLYTIYSPPEHIDRTNHKTKTIADNAHEHWDGKTSE
jgi:mannose-6-phosphate isomerase-like protein (cupin superfamily)